MAICLLFVVGAPFAAEAAVSCNVTQFYCDSSYDACLRGVDQKCTCVANFWACLGSACRTAELGYRCGWDARRLRCDANICPPLPTIEVAGSAWVAALVIFLLMLCIFCGVVVFVGRKREWWGRVRFSATYVASVAGLPVKVREPPLPLAGITLPAEAELPELMGLESKMRGEKLERQRRREKEDREADSDVERNMEVELAKVTAESDLLEQETSRLQRDIMDMIAKHNDTMALELAVGEGNAAALQRQELEAAGLLDPVRPRPPPPIFVGLSATPPATGRSLASLSLSSSSPQRNPSLSATRGGGVEGVNPIEKIFGSPRPLTTAVPTVLYHDPQYSPPEFETRDVAAPQWASSARYNNSSSSSQLPEGNASRLPPHLPSQQQRHYWY